MRHQKSGLKLSRTASHREAMFRNMVTSLLEHGRIRTTDAKAKEVRRWADQMVTLAKRGDLHARRQALAVVRDKTVVHGLFETVQERFGAVEGGYTRIAKVGLRKGDAAPMSIVELVEAAAGPEPTKKSWLKREKPSRPEVKGPEEKERAAPPRPSVADVAAVPEKTVKTEEMPLRERAAEDLQAGPDEVEAPTGTAGQTESPESEKGVEK